MKRYVLDSYALLAYAENEAGADKVADLFKSAVDGRAQLFICVVNWGEMYYIALRDGGLHRADHYRNTYLKYPVEIIDADETLTLAAAVFKAKHKISYADAFAAALSMAKKAELVTGDNEFKSLEKEIKICRI